MDSMVRQNRKNNNRRSRVRRARNSGKNRRSMVLYRKPPRVSAVPRVSGLTASGLSTSVSFTININLTVTKSASGWISATGTATAMPLNADTIFKQRPDAISNIRKMYSEFRLDRMTIHYVPLLGNTSWGQIAIAAVDDQYGIPTTAVSILDVAVAPNSRLLKCTQPGGVAWAPTEASDLDFKDPASVLATILYGCSDMRIEGKFDTTPALLGRLLCVAHLTVRSPLHEMASLQVDLDDFAAPLEIEVCMA